MQTPGPEHDDSFDFLFKIILIGDSNVGKTCVVQNFKSGIFSEKQQNTIGVDFSVRTVDIEGKRVKVTVRSGSCFLFPSVCVCLFPFFLSVSPIKPITVTKLTGTKVA